MAKAGVGFHIDDGYRFASEHGLGQEARTIRNMRIHPTIAKAHVPKKAALVRLFEDRGLMDEFAAAYWPARPTEAGERRRQSYLDLGFQNERLLAGAAPEEDDIPPPAIEGENDTEGAVFAMEGHLRDFIIKNLHRISIGGTSLRLFTDAQGRDGREYPTGVGPIDILAIDTVGNFFVFELKLDRGADRALGQLARYMGWIKVNLASGRDVRGVIVARSMDEKLQYAAVALPGVALVEYEIAFTLRDVPSPSVAQPNIALQPTAGDGPAPELPSEAGRG